MEQTMPLSNVCRSKPGRDEAGLASVFVSAFVMLMLLFPVARADGQTRRIEDPRRATAERLLRPITVRFTDARLADVVEFFSSVTGADIEPMWIDERSFDGLDPERRVTLSVRDMPALRAIERVLRGHVGGPGSATWQFAPTGEFQIGPKSRLNEFATLKIYDVRDMLFSVRSFRDIPNLGLGQITQGQGGSSQSDFEEVERDAGTAEDRAARIVNIITRSIEPEQWESAGGDGASVVFHNGSLLVRAPDYIHRRLQGYSFWPRSRR